MRVIALRAALDLQQEGNPEIQDEDIDALAPSIRADPELDYIRARCAAEFKDAFRQALRFLDPEERNMLRLHLIDGLCIDKIGAIFGIHRATVARRLASARELLSRETQRLLREQLHLTTVELESLVGFLRHQVGSAFVQVAGALAQISVGNAGIIWGINASDSIYRFQ